MSSSGYERGLLDNFNAQLEDIYNLVFPQDNQIRRSTGKKPPSLVSMQDNRIIQSTGDKPSELDFLTDHG